MSLTEEKIANPLNFYRNPHEVDQDQDLTVEEKIKVLTNWLNDVELRQTAEAENMPSDKESSQNGVATIEKLLRKYKSNAH